MSGTNDTGLETNPAPGTVNDTGDKNGTGAGDASGGSGSVADAGGGTGGNQG